MAVLAARAGPLFDACVTDPPYHLTSIVKRFGADNAAPAKVGVTGAYARASRGFMGKTWDGGDVAFRPELWRAVFDQLKPGAHLVAFSGTRTYHRMAVAIEDAGFEIRDQLAWVYASGFPKSLDVSKAIDRAAGNERPIVGFWKPTGTAALIGGQGAATAGVGDDGTRERRDSIDITGAGSPEAAQWTGWGTALKPAWEPICLARKPLVGTVAANVLAHGTGAINVDGCRIGTSGARNNGRSVDSDIYGKLGAFARVEYDKGRFPANLLHDGNAEVEALFPQTGAGFHSGETIGFEGGGRKADRAPGGRTDSGSAARFFYSAKAGPLDRLGSKHPTVKPVDLMRWLCRLVTPPGGLILDPFAGSGTTGIAAMAEGFSAELIDIEADHVTDIERKLSYLRGEGRSTVDEHRNGREVRASEPMPLFTGAAA